MKLFSSLTNRIFFASALLAVLSIGTGIYNVTMAVTEQADLELLRGLDEARTLIDENRRIQVEHFTREAQLIADLPKLKAAVEPYDPPTVVPILEEYQRLLAADLFMVTDRHGRLLARLPDDPAAEVNTLPAFDPLHEGRDTTALVAQPGGILQIVSVPIWIDPDAPDLLGTLSVGFRLDRHAAARFRALTNSEVAFGLSDRIFASTLPAATWPALAPLLARDGLSESVWLDGTEYIAMTVGLSPDAVAGPQPAALAPHASSAKAIILRSRTERLEFLRPLRTALLLTAAFAVLVSIVLSYGVARTVTRPLGAITAAMREMAATGDLTRKIPVAARPGWEDEDARLLATTFNTMTESIDRFQREAAQRERLSSLGRLSTIVAHEIRNPLMIIKAALHGLRKETATPTAVAAAVADIDEEIVRLNRIVSEVLDFAKPIKFDRAPTDLNALCADAVKASSAEPGAPPIALHLDPAVTPVVTDAERLRLVFINLLTNARHAVAARPGASSLPDAIRVVTRLQGHGRVVVEVRDRGTGIAPEDLPKVFDPFFTTRRTGTGLGLAISRNVVEGLGGTIVIHSHAGEGTEVRVELPAH